MHRFQLEPPSKPPFLTNTAKTIDEIPYTHTEEYHYLSFVDQWIEEEA